MAKLFPNSPVHDAHWSWRGDALAPLHFWHLSSLDAPSVAVCWTLSLAWAAGVRLPAWVPLLVALAVWAVYVADRLLDARAGLALERSNRLRERHHFHWKHRRLLVPLAGLAAASAAWILWRLVPAPVRRRDALLAAAALAYFTRVHAPATFVRLIRPSKSDPLSHPSRRKRGVDGAPSRQYLWAGSIGWGRLRRVFSKELLVGLLFTAGCLLPTWSRAQTPAATLATPAAALALLAWLNCALIDGWESDDAGSPQNPGRMLALALAFLALFGSTLLLREQPHSSLLLGSAALSAVLLAALDRNRRRIAPLTLRALADLVLLTPALLLATRMGQ